MKSANSMSHLFEKLNDLKVVFSYGQKIIPVLQSLIDFMRDTVPLLETVNSSIAESTKQMPHASDQLNNISNATELATTEILDLVDIATEQLTQMETQILELEDYEKKREDVYNKLKTHLSDDSVGLELLESMNGFDSVYSKLSTVKETIQNLNSNLFNITLSLQVQDITSQQLNAVNHLIASVQSNLTSLLFDIDGNEISMTIGEKAIPQPDINTFDPKATYSDSSEKQKIADDLLEDHSTKTTQDEIDKLFS